MNTTVQSAVTCFHCGEPCPDNGPSLNEKRFCCTGCKTVYEILEAHELGAYYTLDQRAPGTKTDVNKGIDEYSWLDSPEVSADMLQYAGEDASRITFSLPQIHCSSCIWLLEKLPRLHEGIRQTRVDFLRKSCTVVFSPSHIPLSGVVALLKKIGYPPELNLIDLQGEKKVAKDYTDTYRLGLAGFCFGNIMLLSFPEYLSLGELSTQYARFFGYLNLLLSLPVLLYSAVGYYRSAWASLQQRHLNMDVPISLGIITLFARSAFEILSQTGPGYLDSLAGLVFFLLIGKWFQNKTYAQLAFDREYGDYFPIAVLKADAQSERYVPVTTLNPGEIVIIKNEELIPADGILLSDKAHIDYSFRNRRICSY